MEHKLNRHERRAMAKKGIQMSNVPVPPRRPEVVQEDYVRTCALLGEKVFQVAVLESNIEQLKAQVDKLVGEAKASERIYVEPQQAEAAPAPQPTENSNGEESIQAG